MEVTISENFRYLVVHTGYTSRLVKHAKEIDEQVYRLFIPGWETKYLLYIRDTIWGRGYYDFSDDKVLLDKLKDRLKDYDKCGAIVFRCDSLMRGMGICSILMKYNYCGCFSFENMCEVTSLGDILLLKFDCESG